MFLEAVLSARKKLYISYVGQNPQTQKEMPPSVVVQELLDVVSDSFVGDGDTKAAQRLSRRHPLQAFSPIYFAAGSELRSYSRAAYDGARALTREPVAARPFVEGEVAWDGGEVVELDDLVRFFENPSRAFLQNQLRVYLGRDVTTLATREPVDLDALDRWKIADPLLRRAVRGLPFGFDSVARLGALPVGTLGRREYDGLVGTVEQIASGVGVAKSFAPTEVDLLVGGTRIVGTLPQTGPDGQEYWQYSQLRGRKELALWVRHLVYCAVDSGSNARSRLFGRNPSKKAAVVELRRVADSADLLVELLGFYRAGMIHPLPLFEHASRKYAAMIADGKEPAIALHEAESAFLDERGDVGDDYVRQIYGDQSPFSPASRHRQRAAEVAGRIYVPFLETRVERTL
jgi:exodeoxyribonuclease V gamma subunit